jgi:hypothetical protein
MLKIKVPPRNRWVHLTLNGRSHLHQLLNEQNIQPQNVKIVGYNYERGDCDVLVYTDIPLKNFNCLAFGLAEEI